jgi:hypothetical protein
MSLSPAVQCEMRWDAMRNEAGQSALVCMQHTPRLRSNTLYSVTVSGRVSLDDTSG